VWLLLVITYFYNGKQSCFMEEWLGKFFQSQTGGKYFRVCRAGSIAVAQVCYLGTKAAMGNGCAVFQ
jgi:hypothetical protein